MMDKTENGKLTEKNRLTFLADTKNELRTFAAHAKALGIDRETFREVLHQVEADAEKLYHGRG